MFKNTESTKFRKQPKYELFKNGIQGGQKIGKFKWNVLTDEQIYELEKLRNISKGVYGTIQLTYMEDNGGKR